MNHQRHRRPALVAVVLAAAISLVAVGCGSSDSGSSKDDPTTTAAAAKDTGKKVDAPKKLRIAYQAIPNGDLIVKQQKLLEKALPGTEIDWQLFDSGGSVNEAVAAGDIDLGLAGSSPVSRGISNGIDYRVVWIHDVIGDAEALVVSDDIGGIEDLAGKTIATPFASTSHFSLLAALNDAGVDPSTVKIIDSEPDEIYAAWSQGDIDGAYVWNPNLAKIVDDGGKVLITSADLAEKGQTTYDLGVASNAFAEKYPDVLDVWAKAQDQAVSLIQEDPDSAADIIAAELDITPEEAASQIGDLIFVRAADQAGPDYLGGQLAENLYATAQFNKEQGEIDKVLDQDAYQDAVDAAPATSVGS
ncbi:MAG TPA: glycine betaine ABC transporter substrate-binding protein [Acidimicrobiales bacterium]|nr:glycine betaine ABC transporter substrate-binding protein [Acidimicrobiales bacterium]